MNKKINTNIPLITLGSPYGIGYEIFLRSLSNLEFKNICPVCIGSESYINFFIKLLKINIKFHTITLNDIKNILPLKTDNIKFLLINIDRSKTNITDLKSITSKSDGLYAYESIKSAAELVRNKIFKSIVTLPVSKKNINLIDPSFTGHTEYFQKMWNEKRVFMTFISEKIRMLLLSTHIPLNQVSKNITKDVVKNGLKASTQLKRDLKLINKICFLALNPHASENGLLGKEDLWIKKVILEFNKKNNSDIIGPVPSDTAFTPNNLKKYDLYIACYHDQGLIPFKMLSFKDGVNLSFGMKHIRTSVNHGTGIDLIGKKKADLNSFINAFKLANKLSTRK